jgi:hypothetical protein
MIKEAKFNIKFIINHHKNQAFKKLFSSKDNNFELLESCYTWFRANFTMFETCCKKVKHNLAND